MKRKRCVRRCVEYSATEKKPEWSRGTPTGAAVSLKYKNNAAVTYHRGGYKGLRSRSIG